MVDWIVYYDDGSTFTSDEGNPEDAPRRGVLCVSCVEQEVGRVIHSGRDFYIWRINQWIPVDKFGMLDYLLEPGGYKVILWGRQTTRAIMHDSYVQAFNDKRMVEKTGFLENEYRVID